MLHIPVKKLAIHLYIFLMPTDHKSDLKGTPLEHSFSNSLHLGIDINTREAVNIQMDVTVNYFLPYKGK